jgi:hypothetical protein
MSPDAQKSRSAEAKAAAKVAILFAARGSVRVSMSGILRLFCLNSCVVALV